ncbi:MAG: hypothetical protein ABJG47_04585 [Ekhidna sp.]
MRRQLKILSVIALIFGANVGLAKANNIEIQISFQEQDQEQEGRRKSNQTMMQPDSDMPSESDGEDLNEDGDSESSVSIPTSIYEPIEIADSVKEESVSKYNFIFYFLYKFKYDAEEAP